MPNFQCENGRTPSPIFFSSIMMILAVAVATALAPGVARAQAKIAIFGNHPAAIPQGWSLAPDSQQIDLTAVLALHNIGQLAKLETDLQDRHSPSYHKWLTTDEFIGRFGPTSDEIAAVAGWLVEQGFHVT